ncbi:restriction endonuclease subunit S [Blautia sp. HCP3S3_C12]|uniref:restriction endonuclease subunit S n=1 Tax=unclassified Blautia TaxID=2648079 RepID=UPI003F89E1C3
MKCIVDEIPFELPDRWTWARFSTITINRDSERKPISSSQRTGVAKIYDYYGASGKIDKIDKYIFDEKLLLIGEDGANLLTRNKPIAFFAEGQYWVNNHAHCIDATDKFILEYLCFYINAISLEKYVTGSAQPKMTQDNMNSILIPLPPYSEQKRISQQLNEAMSVVDIIENGKSDVMELVSKAKSKILDLAIRGQLVPQNPDDEPASVLLERIRAEKEELIKQGKIKRDKKESIIFKGEDNSYYETIGKDTVCIDEDLPFDIPDSWHWARLKDVFIINPRNKLNDDFDISFIPMPLIDDGYSGKHTAEVRQWKEVKTGFTHFAEGDVGVAKITPCFENRKSIVFTNLTNGYGAGTTELHILRPIGNSIISQYLLAYLKSDYFVENGKQTFTGAVGQQRISKEYVENAYFPIPSKSEQECIVQTINNMFEYLNVISDALS